VHITYLHRRVLLRTGVMTSLFGTCYILLMHLGINFNSTGIYFDMSHSSFLGSVIVLDMDCSLLVFRRFQSRVQ